MLKQTLKHKMLINNKTSLFCCVIILCFSVVAVVSPSFAADNPNAFNRLFVPPKERDTSLESDGIHDPEVPGLKLLQQPKEAFKPLPRSTGGNYVDWVKSYSNGKIKPLYDFRDASKPPLPMDLDIVMEVKGTMPNVSFPHSTHSVITDCANCHDEIFMPKIGGNSMTMAEIMLGQKCGVCHGSVAFPVTECKRCHSEGKKKATKSKAKSAAKK